MLVFVLEVFVMIYVYLCVKLFVLDGGFGIYYILIFMLFIKVK